MYDSPMNSIPDIPAGTHASRLALLTTLFEITTELSSILDLDVLLGKMSQLLGRVVEHELFALLLVDEERQQFIWQSGIGYADAARRTLNRFSLQQGIAGRCYQTRMPVLVGDVTTDADYVAAETASGKTPLCAMAVPLIFKERVTGILILESTVRDYFTNEHLQVVMALASQLAIAVENARMFKELYNREHKLETDFQIARSMQLSMLPKSMPQLPGLEFAARYIPAGDLAGDLYDFVPLDEHRIGFLLGDVSGKGVSAALVMAAARSALRFAAHGNPDPAMVMFTTNRQLVRGIKNRFYVATFYGILNSRERWFLWSNAGHHPPFRIRADNTVSLLSTGGTVLGLFDNARYQKQRSELAPGDIYVFYTDGVIEAVDTDGREFGTSRLVEAVIANREGSARRIRDAILRRLRRHTRGAEPHDDITLVILKCS
jgi:phosphoserine phosphatase RsbU/P